jgi:cell division control protein 6
MVTLASLRKELEETKENLRRLRREKAEREARGEASQIFKTVSKKTESNVFADPSWVQPTSDPPNLFPVGRELYVESLRSLLEPALRGGAGRNVFVVGPPGTGKTLTIRFVLEQLKEHVKNATQSVGVVFVNAGRTRNPYHTLVEILKALGVDVPPAGWQLGRMKDEFERQRENRAIVIAIDEADSLVSKTREQLLYYLNRQEKVTLLLITNQWDDLSKLPARARSTLQLAPLIFEPYTKEEAKRILMERCALAFKPGAVDDEVVEIAAAFAAGIRDIRAGFNLLSTAGLLAESEGRSKVDLVDLERGERAIRPTI